MFSSLPVTMRKIPIPAVEPKSEVNPILQAFREHVMDYVQNGMQDSDPDMKLDPLDQWCHWLQWGDQEVSDNRAHIEHAERVIFGLRNWRNRAEADKLLRGVTVSKNRVLNDARCYRAERLTHMRNPKGWAHVLRTVEASHALYLRAFTAREYRDALVILRRLARLEKNG
jgi:hypothetical protein